ncbi:hypothetical protein HQ560_13100 [bacterium]|nr:hypothetical protein [bacterium]
MAIDLDGGPGVQQVVLAGAIQGSGGLYRSNDSGETYALISGASGLPTGSISDMIVDPNNSQRIYVAVSNAGVYRGDFAPGGALSWTTVNTGMAGLATAGNIQLAAHDAGASTVLFSLVSGPSRGAFRSTTDGDSWTTLATPPSMFDRDVIWRAANTMEADPTDDSVAYITTYSGGENIFRYNDAGAGSWDPIVGSGAKDGTLPHADGRDLAFLGANVLLDANDGGFYFIKNPLDAANNRWQSFIGLNGDGLGDVEVHNVAWDSRFNVAVIGAQDNGTSVQMAPGDTVYDHFYDGDGGDVAVDTVTLGGAGKSIRYASVQYLDNFNRHVFDSATNITETVALIPAGGLPGFVGQFINPFEISALDPLAGESKRIVIGGEGAPGAVYEATNAGTAANAAAVDWAQVPTGAGFGDVTTMAYGGRLNGADNHDVLYVGSGSRVFLRSTAGGTLNPVATPPGGGTVMDIVLDPQDWQHAFVVSSNRVFESIDAGAVWTEVTGNLADPQLRSLEFIPDDGGVLLAGGNLGVHRMRVASPGAWTEFGAELPNAVVWDMDYDPIDDILVAGTFGRGVWTVSNASVFAASAATLRVNGTAGGDAILLIRNAANPAYVDVFLDRFLDGSFELATLEQIDVNGLGGDDTLTVDSSNGLIDLLGGIQYDGGPGLDGLVLDQTGGDTQTSDDYQVGADIGSGISAITGPSGTQVITFTGLEPVIDLVPAATLTVSGTNADNAINYGPGLVDAANHGLVSVDGFETIEFANKANLVINGQAGDDVIHLNNANTPTGLGAITVIGGDTTDNDTLIVNGGPVGDTIVVDQHTTHGALVTGAQPVPLDIDGVERLIVNGLDGSDTLNVVVNNATITLVEGPAADSGSLTVLDRLPVDFVEVENFLVDGDPAIWTDRLEPNNSIAAATVLGSEQAITVRDLTIHHDDDTDYYQITAHDTGALSLNAFFTHAVGNLDIEVLDGAGNLIATAVSATDDEQLVIPVVSQEMYFLHVYGSADGIGPYQLEIENFAAPVATAVLLDPGSDSGASNSDNVTSVAAARVRIQVDLANTPLTVLTAAQVASGDSGAAVEVFVNGVSVGIADPILGANNTLFEFVFAPGDLSTATFPVAGGGGLNIVKAAVRVIDGQTPPENARTDLSEPLLVTLDSTAPAPSTPDLLTSSDTGSNASDNITAISQPAFSGVAEANSLVRVLANGAIVGQGIAGSDGGWEITVEPLADGDYAMTTQIEDLAGNLSPASSVLNVTIDALAPQRPTLDLLPADDSGVSDSDNVTNAPGPVPFTVTAEAGSWVLIKDGETVIDSFAMPGLSTVRPLNLPEGDHILSVEAFDASGNRSAQSEQLLVKVDRAAPIFASADLLRSSDTGVYDNDYVTGENQLASAGLAEPGSIVRVFANGHLVGQATAGSDESDGSPGDGLGLWEITAEPLDDGAYDGRIEIEDVAGNVTLVDPTPGVPDVWIDTQAPNVPHLDLDAGSDDGWHDDDNVTSIGNPVVNITLNDTPNGGPNPFPNDVQYRIYDRPGGAGTNGEVLIVDSFAALGALSADGFFQQTLSQTLNDPLGPPLAEGVHELKLVVEDRAGNISESFLTLTIDSTAWDLSVTRIANGQVVLYDADATDPHESDVDASDVIVRVNRNNVVTGVTIVGNPTGLGILVMPWGNGSVWVKDARRLPPWMRENLSFIATSGPASLILTKSNTEGRTDLGEILFNEGVAPKDLDGDTILDDATAVYTGGVLGVFRNWYGLGGDLVARTADALGRSMVRVEIRRGGVEAQAEVMAPDGGIGYFLTTEGNVAGHVMTAGGVRTFVLARGSVLTGIVDINGSLNSADLRSGAQGAQINIIGAAGVFRSRGEFNNSTLNVGSDANALRFHRAVNGSTLTFGGNAATLWFRRAVNNTTVTVAGATRWLRAYGGLAGNTAATILGATTEVLVKQGIWDSTLSVFGHLTRGRIYGAVGGAPGSGVTLSNVGFTKFYGPVSADTTVVGNLTGRLIFLRALAANVNFGGSLLGALYGRGFVDVNILGDFLGIIGGRHTANGAGTLTLAAGGNNNGRVMRRPGGYANVTGAIPGFNGAFDDIVVF